MSDTDIHSCGYYCDRPACIKTQRDELRQKLFSDQAVKTYSGGKPNYTHSEEFSTGEAKAWLRGYESGKKLIMTEKDVQTSDKDE